MPLCKHPDSCRQIMDNQAKAAIVTGGGGGIGRAVAIALAGQGVAVAVADLNGEAAETVAGEVEQRGADALAIEADVSQKSSVEAMVHRTLETFGRIDILVNNAGLQYVSPIVDYPEERWHTLIGVMLSGTFFCTQAALPSMLSRRSGRIVNISSIMGRIGAPYKSAYCAAKHGIIGLTRSVALEVAEQGITVNAVCPGVTGTAIVEGQLDDLARSHGIDREEVLDKIFLPDIPQKRILEPDEIAQCVLYLVSDGAFAVTGQAITVSAGWVMR